MNRIATTVLAALIALAVPALPAVAQPSKADLRQKFQAREPQLRELKRAGRVGEAIDGYIDAVDASGGSSAATLIKEENDDRRRLYQILADEINAENPQAKVKATFETVAVRNARRNIERAGPDEFLRVGKDHWIRVKDFPRFEAVAKLKAQGKVGETGEGLVEAVKPEDRNTPQIARAVDEENAARTAEYKALAEKERVDAQAVARRTAQRNFGNARVGEWLKDTGGAWRKK